jgi:hypothetical protein
MADTHTPSLRLRLLEVGANEDTWGDELNANVISMIEEAVAGIVSVSVTAGNVALSTANGTTDQARNALVVLTGTPGATRTVTFPDVEKLTWVMNETGDGSSIVCSAGAGTTVTIPQGYTALVRTDGATNVRAISQTTGGLGVDTNTAQTLANKTLSSPVLSGTAILPGGTTVADNGAGTGIALLNTLNGQSGINFTNASSGTGARTQIRTFNDAGAAAVLMVAGSGNTIGSLFETANRASVFTQGAGGMSLGTSVNQPLIFGVNNAEVARFDSSKLDLTVGQVRFPASQSASADANTLDDYEEGTFTPTLTFGGASVGMTYTTQVGAYTKIGNRVFFDLNVVLTNKGSSTGLAAVS